MPSIARVGNVRADGGIIEGARFAEYWHHDGDFWPSGNNFVINFLSCRLVPEAGGNTGFLDMQIAYQELSPERRRELEGAYIEVRPSEISDFQMAPADELPPNVVHSVLQPHPLSGKIALYLPDSRSGIQAADGHFIQGVAEALAALQAEQAVYQHRWSPGDLLIIDNLQVMHRSMGGFGDSPRLLYRCQSCLPMGKGWSPN